MPLKTTVNSSYESRNWEFEVLSRLLLLRLINRKSNSHSQVNPIKFIPQEGEGQALPNFKAASLQPMAKWDTGRIRAQLTSLKLLYSGPNIHLRYCLHEHNWSTKTKQWISRSVSSVLLAEAWAIDSFPSTNINLACGDARSLDLWTSSNLLRLVHGQVPLSG